jgi:hypothetical protein
MRSLVATNLMLDRAEPNKHLFLVVLTVGSVTDKSILILLDGAVTEKGVRSLFLVWLGGGGEGFICEASF